MEKITLKEARKIAEETQCEFCFSVIREATKRKRKYVNQEKGTYTSRIHIYL